MKIILILLMTLSLLCGIFLPAWALSPAEVLVIANRRMPGSLELAHYYMEKRSIPTENLLTLTIEANESCSRKVYNQQVAQPVRDFIQARKSSSSIRAFVTLYGVPLKVAPPALTEKELAALRRLQRQRDTLMQSIQSADEHRSGVAVDRMQLELLDRKISRSRKSDSGAALDSELTLVLKDDYALDAWQPNPFFVGYQHLKLENTPAEVLLGSRIDAPSLAIARRMIDDSLFAERDGLRGTAYFDAKGPANRTPNLRSYDLYDQSIHLAAEQLKSLNLMPVVINAEPGLFQAGEAPDAALYCGWYSLAKYVDAFDWRRGAIGYHIASGECATLRAGPGQGWCKRMLEDGVTATLGPVAEPYIQAFPEPELFFRLLTVDAETLVEAYFHSQRYLSWQMVLLGDPLYRPRWLKQKIR
ncbi:TIGR03790 family protein [Geopsychrobacter electrodiphilus]|uniref:TIGR03790 family protein n=1 Tax=Geopsychrobacter electrodiphilus TaxID=225196 RepID=UPI0003796CA0|nr:TIGR03790 family protein [Geopsychrobacter electrodiphilus]